MLIEMVSIVKQQHYSPRISIENLQRVERILNTRINKNFDAALTKLLDMVDQVELSDEKRLENLERKLKL